MTINIRNVFYNTADLTFEIKSWNVGFEVGERLKDKERGRRQNDRKNREKKLSKEIDEEKMTWKEKKEMLGMSARMANDKAL